MSTNYELIPMLFTGLGNDFLVTVISIILPLNIGIALTILMHFTRKSPLPKIFRFLSILTEGLAPTAVLIFSHFCVFSSSNSRFIPASVALSLCFMGYMIFRYNEQNSLVKNIVVNGIGLIADMLKWCFCILGYVGIINLTKAANVYAGRTFDYFLPILLLLTISFIILAVLYIIRQICKEFMK